MITNELESDIFPHQIQTKILSSPYFKGVSYLLLSYFVILGGKNYCIVASIITLIFACTILFFAAKIEMKKSASDIDDEYLPECSAEDIVTISQYEPPNMKYQTIFKKPIDDDQFQRDDDYQESGEQHQDITPPSTENSLDRGL